jgi:hypothetical protein
MCKISSSKRKGRKSRILNFVQYGYHQTLVKETQLLATRKKDYKKIVKIGNFSHKIA